MRGLAFSARHAGVLACGLGSAYCASGEWGQDQLAGAGYGAANGDDGGCLYGSCNPDYGSSGSSSGGFSIGGSAAPGPLQPSFGTTTVATRPPPAISGGTLLVTKDGSRAVAADSDRDVIYVVDLAKKSVSSTITLHTGDEPGRLVEDAAGHVHVALRTGGALVTIDPVAGTLLSRRDACPAPRGVAYDAASDQVWVACATGELVALPAGAGAATKTLVVERDLRDVVISNGTIAVSQFRSAQLLTLDASGNIARRDQLPSPATGFVPHVAWRTVAGPSGTYVAVHQAQSTQSLQTHVTGGYGGGGGCGMSPFGLVGGPDAGPSISMLTSKSTGGSTFDSCSLVSLSSDGGTPPEASTTTLPSNGPSPPPTPFGPFGGCSSPSGAVISSLTVVGSNGTVLVNHQFSGVVPVDVAASADGTTIAAVAPGNALLSSSLLSTVFLFRGCAESSASLVINTTGQNSRSAQPIAVAFAGNSSLLVQTREPAALSFVDPTNTGVTTTVALSSITREDTGHDVFHTQAGALVACASCHPEGRDDGHVWLLDGSHRRTPSLRGTIAGTAPYHWPGDQLNLNALVNDVYTVRMAGQNLASPVMNALTGWVQAVPHLPAPSWVDPDAAARGKALFDSQTVGCSGCHSGAKFTNNTTVDVGTGGRFQVPPLVGVGWRTPLFHDGCATTLGDRFGKCATAQHGNIGSLSTGDISDLVAYLETL
jgi:hypothetical protein